MTLTFDLLTSKSIGHILDSWGVCVWSFMMIGVKGKQLCAGNPNADDRRTDGQTDMVIPVYPPPPKLRCGGGDKNMWRNVARNRVLLLWSNLVYSGTYILKGHRHDWGQCLFTKIIWHEILIEFLQKVIQKCTNHFGKDWAINRAEITHKSLYL